MSETVIKTIEEEAADCRKRWEGFPLGTVAHLLHRDQHYEILYLRAEKRIAYILTDKPEKERAARLHWFGPMTGVPEEVARALAQALAQALAAYAQACDQALAAYVQNPAVIAAHNVLFPDCPWNGKTMFPERS